jgi:hypothetical protein
MTTLRVDQYSEAVKEMAKDWDIIEALLGGTPAMRAARQTYLPRWPAEEATAHAARIDTATLFPAFERTVAVMSGKPFSKALTLSEDTPEDIRTWCEDVDMQGVNLHTFAAELMQATAMSYGFGGFLVDTPRATPTSGAARPPTQAEQRSANVRPYFVRVKPRDILGWRVGKIGGVLALTQLRIRECEEVPDGDFGTKTVVRVRVLEPGRFRIYEQVSKSARGAWSQVDSGTTGINVIPFVPIYGRRTGFMRGAPPLRNLAYLNVKHWQSQSDQDTIVHFARIPILFGKGFDADQTIVVGSTSAITTESEQGDLKYVEHTGKAIEAGEKSLDKLEGQMIQSGAELLVGTPGSGGRTATEDENDAEGNRSDLQRIVEMFEDSLDLGLYYMALLTSRDFGGKVTLFKDYVARTLSEATAQLVLAMQQGGLIQRTTAVREQQRRGVLSPDLDPEKEVAAAMAEGPEPGSEDDPAAGA